MILLEIIGQMIIEVFFIEFLGGILIRLNNSILKLRKIETRSVEDIKFDNKRKRYEYKTVKLKRNVGNLKRGKKGVVLELIDLKHCFVEFEEDNSLIEKFNLKDLLISK